MFWKELMVKFVIILKANAVSVDLATNNEHSMVYLYYFFNMISKVICDGFSIIGTVWNWGMIFTTSLEFAVQIFRNNLWFKKTFQICKERHILM